ncbi:signal peptidase I [Erythrobacter arachoides]|uniref:Signal peptidase I n=1 Tax=Aurantiacibacter arachoides TaxID=1850444 RepID=A0A844ZXV9_9SPHN|nr:signal peptidase I [Aurantiacibacter arachoides]MXO92963.1 signal peptidase I [Aurantiacibacter arachoides]GGD53124.1 signal peptidase I [Aurantiacibacter arachoides]
MTDSNIRQIEDPAVPADAPEEKKEDFRSFASFLVKLVIVVLLFRTFAFTSFNIPSESMMPRLLVGDYLQAAKWPYGYSSASLPFGISAGEGRILGSQPERGDIVIFKHPVDRSDYIKRVIGLPGDTVQMVDGVLHLNGAPVGRERVEDFVEPIAADGNCGPGRGRFVARQTDGSYACLFPQFRETLPGGRSYNTLDFGDFPQDDTAPVIVPPDMLFMMGDNRDNSLDSRFPAQAGGGIGLVPQENIVGEAYFMYWSYGDGIRWSRIGKGI